MFCESVILPSSIANADDAVEYYMAFLKLAGLRRLVDHYAFCAMTQKFDYSYPVYRVEEVGYKLSKRKEKIRPNQLCKFVVTQSSKEHPNLHLAQENLGLEINTKHPQRILDFIKRDIEWL